MIAAVYEFVEESTRPAPQDQQSVIFAPSFRTPQEASAVATSSSPPAGAIRTGTVQDLDPFGKSLGRPKFALDGHLFCGAYSD